MAKNIGVLTGGGDCPGLNVLIRAIVRKCLRDEELQCLGILRGWRGLLDGLVSPLTLDAVSGILPRGGTILRTSQSNPLAVPDGPIRIAENVRKFNIDGIVAIGGSDSMKVAETLHREHGLPVVGVPATIDNDVHGTDYSFGFDSAINIAMEAIDRIHTTAESHDRVMIIEVMGGAAGWIAIHAGLAGGADMILVPEKTLTVQQVCDVILRRHDRGKDFSIVVVAEGARIAEKPGEEGDCVVANGTKDEFGQPRLGGVGSVLGKEIERRTGFETRVTVLGHIQRGGSPTAFDRALGARFGVAAVDLIVNGRFGKMVALQGDTVTALPLGEITGKCRRVPEELYEVARTFFG
jgi:6-phosphofructokinase 1